VPAGTGTGTGAVTGAGTATASCVPRPTSTGAAVASGAASVTQAASSTDGNDSTQRGRPTSVPSAFISRFGPQPTDNAKKNKRQEINYCDNSDPSSTNVGFTPILSGAQSTMKKRLAAHGILAALAFVILFPAGAIAVRLASFRLVVWFHAGFQMFAYLIYIAAFGLGVTMANDLGVVSLLPYSHLPAISTNSIPAELQTPHHWHSRLCRPLHPTFPRLSPPLYVQEIPNTHRRLARPYLVW